MYELRIDPGICESPYNRILIDLKKLTREFLVALLEKKENRQGELVEIRSDLKRLEIWLERIILEAQR